MSTSRQRQKRCMNAIGEVLDFLHKQPSEADVPARLQNRFLSPGSILEGGLHELSKDLDEPDAQLLSLIPSLARYSLRTQNGLHPRLDSLPAASEFLKSLYIGIPIEQFYLLCLDGGGRLIQCRLLQNGTIDETPFYLEHVLQSIVTTGAAPIILSHNHPGGTPRPSQADIRCTRNALLALFPLRIPLLDHIIIADRKAVSIRAQAQIPADWWTRQDPESFALRQWLDEH